jgi:hypothetical protein
LIEFAFERKLISVTSSCGYCFGSHLGDGLRLDVSISIETTSHCGGSKQNEQRSEKHTSQITAPGYLEGRKDLSRPTAMGSLADIPLTAQI